jgi:hypothetical protein
MYETYEAAIDAIQALIDEPSVRDDEVAQCEDCLRYGDAESDDMRYEDEPGVWQCEECAEAWHRQCIADALYDVRGRLDWQERTGRLTLSV